VKKQKSPEIFRGFEWKLGSSLTDEAGYFFFLVADFLAPPLLPPFLVALFID